MESPWLAFKPSFGLDGTHCMCVKSNEKTTYVTVPQSVITDKQDLLLTQSERDATVQRTYSESDETENTYYLYASDFEDGTYIIGESGTYIVMEDIEFDFKSKSYQV